MRDIYYYPVIDCDPEGTEKVAMCMCKNRNTIISNHGMWLEEVVPYYFRLYVRNGSEARADGKYRIHCPYCNKVLIPIAPKANRNKRELFVCDFCNSYIRKNK